MPALPASPCPDSSLRDERRVPQPSLTRDSWLEFILSCSRGTVYNEREVGTLIVEIPGGAFPQFQVLGGLSNCPFLGIKQADESP